MDNYQSMETAMETARRKEEEKTKRLAYFWMSFAIVMGLAIVSVANAYGSTLAREEEMQRYAIIQQRGGEPVCAGPDGIYVRFPQLQQTPGETG